METLTIAPRPRLTVSTPLSQGKPIEWKLQVGMKGDKFFWDPPLSQGKPIEWKQIPIGKILGHQVPFKQLPSRRGNQLNGNLNSFSVKTFL